MAIALVALSAQSCKDYLDEELVSNVAADSYYSTPAGLDDGADAAYAFLREIYSNERSYSFTVFGTDTHTNGADGGWKSFNYYDNGLNPGAGILLESWNFLYQGINQTNAIISRAPNVEGIGRRRKNHENCRNAFSAGLLLFLFGTHVG